MQNQQIGGLLGSAAGSGAPMQSSGLLGAAPQQAAPGGAGDDQQAMQMAQALLQSPTPKTVQMIVGHIQKTGAQGFEQIAQVLTENASDPEKLKDIAQQVIQALQK